MGRVHFHNITHMIEDYQISAKALSSRTVIRNAIAEYQQGKISYEELCIFTQEKYLDGIKAMNNPLYAERMIGHSTIAQYGNFEKYHLLISNAKISNANIKIVKSYGRDLLIVNSPIIIENQLVANDLVIFNLSEYLEEISGKEITGSIVFKTELDKIKLDETQSMSKNREVSIRTHQQISYYAMIDKDWLFKYAVSPKTLFFETTQLTKSIVLNWVLITLALIIFILYISAVLLKHSENKSKKYENQVNIDTLTGAYSRAFLELWQYKHFEHIKQKILVMLDINDFKQINDIYGHLAGDKALIMVADTFKSHINENDFLIRVGGDEFLLIVDSEDMDSVEKLISRIQQSISNFMNLPFKVTLSYGCSILQGKEDFEEAYAKADEAMYHCKSIYKLSKRVE